ncbi:MAG: FAD-binding oxidoreductase, partial [Actinomycetota bacterium]
MPAIGGFVDAHGIDAWFDRAAHVGIATSPQQDGSMDHMPELVTQLRGPAGRFERMSPEDVQAVCRSAVFRGGIRYGDSAMVHPGRLVRGMRRVALDRGIRLFEHTSVTRFREGPPAEAETPGGTVRAGHAVLAINAWSAQWKRFRSTILPRASYIVLTAPAPERLAEIGWTGGEGLFDFRTSLHYVRTTRDGRIAFGGVSSRAGLGTGLGPRQWYDERSVRRLAEDLWRWFPSFSDVPIEAAWGGPIDVSGHHIPFFGTLPGTSTHYGFGFTGGGVGPCHMGGRILAGLVLGLDDEYTNSPLVGYRPKRFPPEPLLSLGAAITQEAIVRADDARDHG